MIVLVPIGISPIFVSLFDLTDADGDGYAAWEDRDDNDASAYDDCCHFGTCVIGTQI